jgi:hypothetical protein
MATLEAKLIAHGETMDETIEIWRAHKNDYWANFLNSECSVRGTLFDVMNEIYSIYEDVEEA